MSPRSRFQRTSVRHRSSWEPGPETSGNGASQAISVGGGSLAGTAVQATVDGLTLIRTRGELLIYLRLATASDHGFHGAFGIAKATTAAIVAGAASVPTPITEEGWDGWLYHWYFSTFAAGPIAMATAAQETAQNHSTVAAVRIEVDSKAMRKWDIDEGIYAAIEVLEVGMAEMSWAFNSRLLVKEM